MSMISIALKDLQIFFKNRNELLTTFLLPVIFIVAFVGISGAAEGRDTDTRIPLPLVNLDPGGEMAEAFIANVETAGGIKLETLSESDAEAKLESEEISRVLIIPANFSSDLAAGKSTRLVLKNRSGNQQQTQAVLLVLEGVARDMSIEQQIVASLLQLGQMQANDPDAQGIVTSDRAITQAKSQFDRAKTTPLVGIQEIIPVNESEPEVFLGSTQILVPGFTVLFIFLTAQTTGRSIFAEKKIGSFRRLLAAPISKGELLGGKLIPNFIIVILQIVFVFGIAMFVFPLIGFEGLSLGNAPFALLLAILVVALSSTALGIAIAGLARTESQVSGIASVVMWILGFLGGAIIPFYLLGGAFETIGQATPHYWALTTFNDLLVRGQGLGDIVLSLVILLGFSLLFFVIGLWRFDFE